MVNVDDFGKNRRFPGFGSVDGDKITIEMHVRMRFSSIPGRSARAGLPEFARDFNFVRKLEKSDDFTVSVRFGPSGPHMSPALTDRPGRPKNGKNLCLSDSLRCIALAGSVLHFHLCIFAS